MREKQRPHKTNQDDEAVAGISRITEVDMKGLREILQSAFLFLQLFLKVLDLESQSGLSILQDFIFHYR